MTGSKQWPSFRSPAFITAIRITSKHFSPISAVLGSPPPTLPSTAAPINTAHKLGVSTILKLYAPGPTTKASNHYTVDLFAGTAWFKIEPE